MVKQLSGAKNIFADMPRLVEAQKIALPPGSAVEITDRSLTIKNPVCKVVWELSIPFSVFYIDPRTRSVSPKLPSGQQKHQTFTQRFKVTFTYFALRSQRRDMAKYRAWTTRLLADCHRWFEQRGDVNYADNGVPQ